MLLTHILTEWPCNLLQLAFRTSYISTIWCTRSSAATQISRYAIWQNTYKHHWHIQRDQNILLPPEYALDNPNTITALESMPLNSALLHYLLHMQKLSPMAANPILLHSFSPFFRPLSTWTWGLPVFRKAKNVGSGFDMTAQAIARAKLPSNHYHQQTNTNSFSQAGYPSCHTTNSV